MKKHLFFIALFFVALAFSSCFKSDECDPNKYCNTERPDSAWVNVTVSYSPRNVPVPFVIYNGDVEDDLIVLRDTAYMDVQSYYLPAGERYSIKASYVIDGTSVQAYDGGKLRVEKFWNCDERCYEAPDLNLDCSLLE